MPGDLSLRQRLLNALRPHGWVVDHTTLTWTYLVKYSDGDDPQAEAYRRIPSDFATLPPVEHGALEALLYASATPEELLEVFGVQ